MAQSDSQNNLQSSARDLPKWLQPSSLLLGAALIIVVWLVFVPLASLLYIAFAEDTPTGPGALSLENFVTAYKDNDLPGLMKNSLIYGAGTAIMTLFMGASVAWVVERTDAPWRNTFHILALLSFALPGLLTTMAWILIFSPNIGWANNWLKDLFALKEAPVNIYTMTGMIWALSSHYFPLAYLLMSPAFRALDTRMEEAARVAGARNGQIALRVTLPLLRPAILSVLLLLFVRGIESFEVPRLLGIPANINVFTTAIQNATSEAPPELGVGGALGLTLLLICVAGVWLYRRATSNASAFATITGKGYKPQPINLGQWRWPVTILTSLLFFAALGLPLFTLIWQSFFPVVTQPAIANLSKTTLENYTYLFSYPVFLTALQNSAMLGAMAATIVVGLAFLIGWMAQRSNARYAWTLDAISFTPIAIPSVIIGASILFAYIMIPIGVYNTIWILLIAYVTMYLPYGVRFASGGIAQIHKELEEASEMSGATILQTFRKVLAPLLAPVLIAAWLYVFVLAVRELAASIFLSGPGTQVLGTVSLTMWEEGGSFGAVCALGVLQIIPLLFIVIIMRMIELKIASRD
ncbi:MAG: iron ABC transporter permease [Beijerinckiaceae bacterium]|mgnify:CR=1 FL=1|jgi:iron(III) transport system permease protein|nr:iron ABC transporter permease [Beijerinckiaceae bacterium]